MSGIRACQVFVHVRYSCMSGIRACQVFVTSVCAEKLRVSRIRDNGPQRVNSLHAVDVYIRPQHTH